MTKQFRQLFTSALSGVCVVTGAYAHDLQECLWYRQPAFIQDTVLPWSGAAKEGNCTNLPGRQVKDPWESQTLPIGNGRVGGTVFGGDHLERVVLNEVSLWTGGPNIPNNGAGYQYGPKSGKDEFGCYQPFGDLYISFEGFGQVQDYTRSLDLRDATARISFQSDGVKYERSAFVSEPDQVLVYSATADKPGKVSAKIALLPNHDAQYRTVGSNSLSMSGTLANGECFEGSMLVRTHGGKVRVQKSKKGQSCPYIQVEGADRMEILVSLATDYAMDYKKNWKGSAPSEKNRDILARAGKKNYGQLIERHVADYRSLYNRLHLELGKSSAEQTSLPTDERLKLYRNTAQSDPELEALLYQYGRYILISSSRPGNLPANLQGIWNDKVRPVWACDYHNNINLQMCYWGAEVANLSECHLPFIRFIDVMQEPLHAMTQKQFGADYPGWTTRISQNPWGGGGWKKWNPPVNAWYALHVWEHYLYTQDVAYLEQTAYPILRNICHFWEKHLKEVGEGGEGLLSEGKPLTAEEHPELRDIRKGTLVAPDGWSHEWGPIEDGCMHDQQLIWELFDNTAKAASILGRDEAWAKKLLALRDRLAGNRIAAGGYLQEWIVDRPDKVSGHRHTSHLIGVFPGTTISRTKTPELAAAAMKSLELRGLTADNRRSWTWPWRTALWARFGKTDRAYEMVQNYLRYNVLDNLFGNHPPMQMDGTFGITGGISEMLIQSHAGQIELLPTLPKAWANGSVSGIRARGNITVDMKWQDGKVTDYKLTTDSPKPCPVKVIVNGASVDITPTPKKGKK